MPYLTPSPSIVHKTLTPEPKVKAGVDEEKAGELEELRIQIKELLLSVELLKTQQT